MSQNARVALWVPTLPPFEIGSGIVTEEPPTTIGAIPTKFQKGGSGGGGGIEEAPLDGQQYARANGAWAVVITGGGSGGGIAEAPIDSKPYVRINGAWDMLDGGTF